MFGTIFVLVLAMGIGEGIGTLLAELVEYHHSGIKLKKREGKDLCMICDNHFVSTVFQPCGSELMCSPCAKKFWEIGNQSDSKPKCPQCHDIVENIDYN